MWIRFVFLIKAANDYGVVVLINTFFWVGSPSLSTFWELWSSWCWAHFSAFSKAKHSKIMESFHFSGRQQKCYSPEMLTRGKDLGAGGGNRRCFFGWLRRRWMWWGCFRAALSGMKTFVRLQELTEVICWKRSSAVGQMLNEDEVPGAGLRNS